MARPVHTNEIGFVTQIEAVFGLFVKYASSTVTSLPRAGQNF